MEQNGNRSHALQTAYREVAGPREWTGRLPETEGTLMALPMLLRSEHCWKHMLLEE